MQPGLSERRGAMRRVGFGALVLIGAVMSLVACATVSAGSPGSTVTAPVPTTSATAAVPTPTSSATPAAPSPTASPTPGTTATVTIVSSGADGDDVFASGLVTGDAGEEGTCTLTATSATGRVLTAQVEAHATPAAVNCGLIKISADPGDWTLVLSFESPTSASSSVSVLVHQP